MGPIFLRRGLPLSLAVLSLFAGVAPCAHGQTKHNKTVWNYDGGLLVTTDGSLPNGPCFRLNGRATAPDFFENLKREDSSLGTLVHRGHDIVTEFPAQLHLSFFMYDRPCSTQLQQAGTHIYLTRAAVSGLRLSFFWKRGMELRPATGVVPAHFETRRVPPYDTEHTDQLPEKLEWIFEFDVPSAGVPVTDSLVVIMRAADGYVAARAALRM
jgi:hypothetical protein